MDHFSTFIQSLRQKINKGELERKKIADIISIHIGVDVKTKDLHIKNNTVRVSVSGAIRQELSFKKESILEAFKKEGLSIKTIL